MLSPSTTIWKQKSPIRDVNPELLSTELKMPLLYGILMANRGISLSMAHDFFNPSLALMHDPMLMDDMNHAVNRILQSIHNKENIMVFGDYDVDGTTGVSLFYMFLKHVHPLIEYYIPDRYTEGYGLSAKGIETAAAHQCKLLIAIDCGIRSVELTSYAKSLGIDMIICDHHLPGLTIPDAIAVLDPKKESCKYPFKELSGCGIAFKLAQALNQVSDFWPEEYYLEFIDLVAVSTCCDIVPLVGENRILVHHGLKKLNVNPRLGFRVLMQGTEKESTMQFQVTDVVFRIGPRINAAGRIESGSSAVELLTCDEDKLAGEFGNLLTRLNQQRSKLDVNITAEAFEMIDADPDFPLKVTTVLYNPHWHKGVVGIVASRMIEKYYRPTLILTESDGLISGSARSIEAVDVHAALTQCESLLTQFGGHRHAAGLKLEASNLEAFKKMFNKVVATMVVPADLQPTLWYETQWDIEKVSNSLYDNIRKFGPFGPENMEPVFFAKNVFDSGYARTMGNDHEHLKLNLISKNRTDALSAIGFNLGHHYKQIKEGARFDILYTLGVNHFRGESQLQLEIKDIKFAS